MSQQNNLLITIAKDFTTYPGARYRSDGDKSGQEFYEDLLRPALNEIWDYDSKSITIDFDGTYGYASSFISEVFIRVVNDFKDKDKIKKKLVFKSDDDPLLKDRILQIINET